MEQGIKQNYNSQISLREALQMFIDRELSKHNIYSRMGQVISVDDTESTCTVKYPEDDTEVEGVQLQRVANDSGLFIKPSVNSYVVITWINNTTAYIALTSEIDEIVFQNGDNGGLVKVSDLVDKLNTLESDLNTLKQNFSSWVTVPNDGGAALKTATATWAGQTITETTIDDLENPNFKH